MITVSIDANCSVLQFGEYIDWIRANKITQWELPEVTSFEDDFDYIKFELAEDAMAFKLRFS